MRDLISTEIDELLVMIKFRSEALFLLWIEAFITNLERLLQELPSLTEDLHITIVWS